MLSYDRARPVLLSRFRGAPHRKVGSRRAMSHRRLNSPTNHHFHRARRRARQISPTKSKAGSGQTHAKGVARACRPRARDAVSDRARYFALERRTAWSIAFDAL